MKEIEFKLSNNKGNLIAFALTIVISLFFVFIFYIKGTGTEFKSYLNIFKNFVIYKKIFYLTAFTLIFIFGIVIHEFIHAFCFSIFNKNGWKTIKFGINTKLFAVYVHCNEYIKARNYRIVTIMPTVILGFLPFAIYLFNNNPILWLFAMLLTTGGSGDFIILWLIKNLKSNTLVKDHQTNLGYYLIEK